MLTLVQTLLKVVVRAVFCIILLGQLSITQLVGVTSQEVPEFYSIINSDTVNTSSSAGIGWEIFDKGYWKSALKARQVTNTACIQKQSCLYAAAILENSTHFTVLKYLAKAVLKNQPKVSVCIGINATDLKRSLSGDDYDCEKVQLKNFVYYLKIDSDMLCSIYSTKNITIVRKGVTSKTYIDKSQLNNTCSRNVHGISFGNATPLLTFIGEQSTSSCLNDILRSENVPMSIVGGFLLTNDDGKAMQKCLYEKSIRPKSKSQENTIPYRLKTAVIALLLVGCLIFGSVVAASFLKQNHRCRL